jgi:hypothetical protein
LFEVVDFDNNGITGKDYRLGEWDTATNTWRVAIRNLTEFNYLSQLQNSVSFAIGYAVFRPTGYKTAVFSGRNYKTEVLQFSHLLV